MTGKEKENYREEEMDRWASWLLAKGQALSPEKKREIEERLNAVRDGVLNKASLGIGQSVLDLGAGTGLLTLKASRRVGESGRVVAADISADALRECVSRAGSAAIHQNIQPILADAIALPFQSESFDAVVTRSVLIYVRNLDAAIAECSRVLKPGGRLSLWEPVNRLREDLKVVLVNGLESLEPMHSRVMSYVNEHFEAREAMMQFEQQKILELLLHQDFTAIGLTLEVTYAQKIQSAEDAAHILYGRPNPTMPSIAESAKKILLPDEASTYLEAYRDLLISKPSNILDAIAVVTANKS